MASGRLFVISVATVLGGVLVFGMIPDTTRGDGFSPKKVAIAEVRPGMTPTQVKRRLGAPVGRDLRETNDGRRPVWHFPDLLTVVFEPKPRNLVDMIRTRSPRDRLATGLHVGSGEQAISRYLDEVKCFDRKLPTRRDRICVRLWAPPGALCGLHLTFYMKRRHGAIQLIELANRCPYLGARLSATPAI